MKVHQVSTLVSKKIGRNFCSWSVSLGATAEVEQEEDYTNVIRSLESELKGMVSVSLPSGNGNGKQALLQ